MAKQERLVRILGSILSILFLTSFESSLKPFASYDEKILDSQIGARKIVTACARYYFDTDRERYPRTFQDLLLPFEKPYIDGGQSAFRDAWGRPYNYVVYNSDEGPELFVWFKFERDGNAVAGGA